jgi:hypothetical protein
MGSCEFLEIGGNVHRLGDAAVHAADTPGREHPDAGHRGENHRCCHGRRAVCATADDKRDVATAGLDNGRPTLAQATDLRVVKTDLQPPTEDGDGRRNRAALANRALNPAGGFDVLGIRHAVGDDGRLEGNDGFAVP